jgi:hypothetical protein
MQPKTPEEKLLRIIEGPLGKEPKKAILTNRPSENLKLKGFSFKGLLKPFNQKLLSVKNMNRALAGASACLTVFALAYFGVNFMNFRKSMDAVENVSYDDMEHVEKELATKINMDEALRQIKAGNLFAPIVYEQEITISSDTQAAKRSLQLVGVIWSANPQVIIEDGRDKKTYLVSAGESIAGGILIKEIFRDKAVVVSKEGEKWELR